VCFFFISVFLLFDGEERKCSFDIKGQVTGFGNPDWMKTHEPAEHTALIVTVLRKQGASCVGRTVIDEFLFGLVFNFLMRCILEFLILGKCELIACLNIS
jgi:Amidase